MGTWEHGCLGCGAAAGGGNNGAVVAASVAHNTCTPVLLPPGQDFQFQHVRGLTRNKTRRGYFACCSGCRAGFGLMRGADLPADGVGFAWPAGRERAGSMAHIFTSCCMPMGPQSPQAKLSLVGPYRAQQHAKHAHGWDADHRKTQPSLPVPFSLLVAVACNSPCAPRINSPAVFPQTWRRRRRQRRRRPSRWRPGRWCARATP